MEVNEVSWSYWKNKKVFLILKGDKRNMIYHGEIIDVDDSIPNLIHLTINDKFNHRITFVTTEVELIKEEEG